VARLGYSIYDSKSFMLAYCRVLDDDFRRGRGPWPMTVAKLSQCQAMAL
jgi:hypothetical protein